MFETVVLALDGSESSDKAFECARSLAKMHSSNVQVVHVVEIVLGRGGGRLPLNESDVQAKVEGQVKELTDAGIKAQLIVHTVPAGGPAHAIAENAGEAKADLIITGTRGHTALAGMVLGSVPQRLLHLTRCPLLVVPLG